MSPQIMVQSTPNPNAVKFVLDMTVKTEGNHTYNNVSEAKDNLLAEGIFDTNKAINAVYFFDNYITVTQDGSEDWDNIEDMVKLIINARIGDHDPDFVEEVEEVEIPSSEEITPDMIAINKILDKTVRPALQMDGGDLTLID